MVDLGKLSPKSSFVQIIFRIFASTLIILKSIITLKY
jgi:hypothetical protein